MKKFGEFICKHKIAILIIAVLLCIPSIYGMMATRVNYDILSYLPSDIETVQGEKILSDDFNMESFSIVLVKDMPQKNLINLENEFRKIDSVKYVMGITDVTGSQILKDGANTYSEKMGEFNTGVATYANGVNTVSTNYSKINDGISSVNENTKKITEGSSNLSSGIKDLKSNLSTIISAMGSIKTGADAIDGGISKMETSVKNNIETLTSSTYKDSETAKTLAKLGTATETSVESLKATKNALETTVSNMEDDETKTELQTEIAKLDEQISNLGKNTVTERAAYNKAMEAETKQVLTGLNTLKTSLQTLKGVSGQVTAGINQLVSGSPELQAGLDKLETGSNTLSSGAKNLSDGTSTLSSESKELKSGIDTLNSNSETIKSSSNQLNDAAKTLSDGMDTLSDGMKQFDNDGINTIYNFVNGDVKGAQNRVEKLMDLAKNSSSYKYVLKVDNLK